MPSRTCVLIVSVGQCLGGGINQNIIGVEVLCVVLTLPFKTKTHHFSHSTCNMILIWRVRVGELAKLVLFLTG